MLKNGIKDTHVYMTAEDQKNFALIKSWMKKMGVSGAGSQGVIRFALFKTAALAKQEGLK